MRRETNIDAEYVRIKIQELTKRAIQVGTFLYYSWTVCRSTGVTEIFIFNVLRFLQIKTFDLCRLTRDISPLQEIYAREKELLQQVTDLVTEAHTTLDGQNKQLSNLKTQFQQKVGF